MMIKPKKKGEQRDGRRKSAKTNFKKKFRKKFENLPTVANLLFFLALGKHKFKVTQFVEKSLQEGFNLEKIVKERVCV